MHTYAHTWNHVPSLWFEFTTCRRTHMQMWRLGSDTHVQTIHEHSPTWHMYISSSPALTRMHRDSLGKSNSVQLNLIQPSSVQQMLIKHLLYAMDYLALRILNFFFKMKSQVTVQGRRQPRKQMQQVNVLRAVADVQRHTYTHTHSHPGGYRHMFSNTCTHTQSLYSYRHTHTCEGIHTDTTHTGWCAYIRWEHVRNSIATFSL